MISFLFPVFFFFSSPHTFQDPNVMGGKLFGFLVVIYFLSSSGSVCTFFFSWIFQPCTLRLFVTISPAY